MTKGQRAMAVARIYPDSFDRAATESVKNSHIDRSYISRARTVLRHASDLANDVLAGARSRCRQHLTRHGRAKVPSLFDAQRARVHTARAAPPISKVPDVGHLVQLMPRCR